MTVARFVGTGFFLTRLYEINISAIGTGCLTRLYEINISAIGTGCFLIRLYEINISAIGTGCFLTRLYEINISAITAVHPLYLKNVILSV